VSRPFRACDDGAGLMRDLNGYLKILAAHFLELRYRVLSFTHFESCRPSSERTNRGSGRSDPAECLVLPNCVCVRVSSA
jgi:hypothetical protein